MKNKKPNSKPRTPRENPFVKMLRDKRRIQEAVANGVPLSSLKDIAFVHPV